MNHRLVVQQERRATHAKGGNVCVCGRENFSERAGVPYFVEGFDVAKQSHVGCRLPLLGVRVCKESGNRETESQRLEACLVGDCHANTGANFIRKFAGRRSEGYRFNPDTAVNSSIEVASEQFTIEPGGAEQLEWSFGTASDREIGCFEQADARIEDRGIQAANVRRRVHPCKASVIKELAALPVVHSDDSQVKVQLEFCAKHQCQLTDGHAMPDRNAMKTDEGLLPFIEQRASDIDAVNRVRSIEYDEANTVLGRRLHRVAHGGDVGVKTRTNLLNVEHKDVDIAEHGSRWPTILAIQTDDRNSRGRLNAVADFGDVELTRDAVFGTEDSGESNIVGGMQNFNAAAAGAINARMIGDETDAQIAEHREIFLLQYVEAAVHASAVCFGKRDDAFTAQQKKYNLRKNNSPVSHTVDCTADRI